VKVAPRLAFVLLLASLGCPAADAPGPGGASGEAEEGALERRALWPPVDPDVPLALAADPLAPNYYVILDGSGSMGSSDCAEGQPRISAAKDALETFARALPESANLGLLAFDALGVQERLPLGPRNRDAFIAAVDRVGADQGTPLQSAIRLGYRALTRRAQSQRGYGTYNLVVVTDGEASTGEDPTEVVAQILSESPVVIHTIGFCIDAYHSLNQEGRVFYRSATDPAQLRAGLEDVLAEAPSFDVANF
jgi:Ca-activated chloride channel homolog